MTEATAAAATVAVTLGNSGGLDGSVITPNIPFTGSHHLVALDPQGMAQSQASLALWFASKVREVGTEADELAVARDEAKRHKWNTKALARQYARAVTRRQFYEKCLAAVEAGFTIIPNIPVDVFAIRVDRASPSQTADVNTVECATAWNLPRLANEKPDVRGVGEGRYESPVQMVCHADTPVTKDNKAMIRREVWPTGFCQVEFPIIAAHPEVMSATKRAMALRIFDEIGVSPQNTRKGDPLIIGHVLGAASGYGGQQRKAVSFLIAWHLDLRVL